CRRCTGWSTRTTTSTGGTRRGGRRKSERREIRGICLCRCYGEFKEGPAAACLHDLRRSHYSTEIFPAAVNRQNMHVAHDVVWQPGFDPVDDILIIHVTVDGVVFAGRRLRRWTPAQNGVVFAIYFLLA